MMVPIIIASTVVAAERPQVAIFYPWDGQNLVDGGGVNFRGGVTRARYDKNPDPETLDWEVDIPTIFCEEYWWVTPVVPYTIESKTTAVSFPDTTSGHGTFNTQMQARQLSTFVNGYYFRATALNEWGVPFDDGDGPIYDQVAVAIVDGS